MESKFFGAIILMTFLIGIFTFSGLVEATHFQCKGAARCLTGTITKVTDGDTLILNKIIKIRLSLVDTPEKKDKIGWKKATDFTTKLCFNTIVKVDEDDKQKQGSYKRIVGVVYCGETNLNAALFDAGLAKVVTKFCKKSEFANEPWVSSICQTKNRK